MKKILGLFFSAILGLSLYGAEVIVDTQASPKLQMDKAANGVPLVNIQAPNEKGLSQNVFQEYNVGKEGIVYNNGIDFKNSELGGLIYGNPNLQAGQKAAETILAEVSGSGRSTLEGFTEIAGEKANYILANPNGIYINGAGFINTNQVSLTTGNPHTGVLEKGSIEVDGKGLDVRKVNRAALIARVAKLSGPIYGGEEVRFELGATQTSSGDKPEFSLDARNLGSLYAGRIEIISNEEGVGVKSDSSLRSLTGDIQIQTKGKISVKKAESKENIQIRAKELDVNENMAAEGNISFITDLHNLGRIEANRNLNIQGKVKNEGDLFSYQNIILHSDRVENTGKLFSKTGLQIRSRYFQNEGKVFSKKALTLQSPFVQNLGKIHAEEGISIESQEFQNQKEMLADRVLVESNWIRNQGEIAAKNSLQMKGNNISNEGLFFSEKEVKLQQQDLTNRGNILSEEGIDISEGKTRNSGTIHAKTTLSIAQDFLLNEGKILSEQSLSTKTKELSNQGDFVSKEAVKIETNKLENSGKIYSDNRTQIKADAIVLSENISAKEILSLETPKLQLANAYRSKGDMIVKISGEYRHENPLIVRNLQFQAKKLENHSILASRENLFLQAEGIENRKNSIIYSGKNLRMQGKAFDNYGDVFSKGDLALSFSGNIQNLTATIESEGNALIQAKNFINQGHITGFHTKTWVPGFASSVKVSSLPASFLEEVDQEMEIGLSNTGRKRSYWHGNDRHLSKAEQGISHYISHKSYLQAKKHLTLEIEEKVLNQEADIQAGEDIQIQAKELMNTREGKEIPILLEFARTYSYSKRKRGHWKTRFDEIYVHKPYTQMLYSDKPTRIMAGGKLKIVAQQLGNGETYSERDPSLQGRVHEPNNYLQSNTKQADTSFQILNNSLTEKIKQEGAISVTDYIELPKGKDGLFKITSPEKQPKFSYLIETNPWFVDKGMYLGSEYFFSRISFSPDRKIRLLGDSYYETKLINRAVLEGTGKRYLYSQDNKRERKMLFDAGIQAQKDLKLSLGIALTPAQRQALKADILWYVEEEVQGEKVLVPKLYLSKATLASILKEEGTVLSAGGNIQIQASSVSNEGKIQGEGNVLISSNTFFQDALYEDTKIVGKSIQIAAKESLHNIGGDFLAKEDLLLHSDGKIENEKKIEVHDNHFHKMYTTLRGNGKLKGQNVQMVGASIENRGASIFAKEDVVLFGKEGVILDTVEAVHGEASGNPKDFVKTVSTRNIGSNVEGKKVQILSGKDFRLRGSILAAKEGVKIEAKDNVEIIAAQDSDLYERQKQSSKSFGRGSTETELRYTTSHRASQVLGDQLQIMAGNNMEVLGSHLQAGSDGKVALAAGGTLLQAGVKDTEYSFYEKTKRGFLGITKKQKSQESYREEAIRSATMAGVEGVTYHAKHDLVLEGANVVSTGTIAMEAQNISIQPLETDSWEEMKEKKRGFAGSFTRGNLSFSYGTDKKEQSEKNRTQNTSQITAGKDIQLHAKESVQGTSVDMYAKEDIHIQGEQGVTFTAAKNTSETHTKQSSNRLGVSVGVKSELVNTIENVKNVKKLIDFSGNSYEVANTASKLVGAIKDGVATVNIASKESYGDQKNPDGTQSAGNDNYGVLSTDWKDYVSANVGLTKSKAENARYQENVVKNKVESGGTIAILSKEGNVYLEGMDMEAGKDILLLAKDKVEVKAATEEATSSFSSSQRALNAGISATGVTLTASTSGKKGKGEGTSYVNSHLKVGGEYKVLAKDIVHEGANVEANTIHMLGETIRISSKQDHSKQNDSSYGGSLSVNIMAPALSSVSLSGSKGKGEGAWVNEQSTLLAKEGGSLVAKEFENRGAIVGSHSETNKLQVQAERIQVEDLEDKNKYENKGGGISLSSKVPNLSIKHDKVDKEQATRATTVNTNFVVAGEHKTAEELGFHTELSKAQEVTKEEEKHLHVELHTDLLGKDKQEEFVRVGNVIGDLHTAIVDKNNTKGDFVERYRQGRILRGLSEEMQKNPEWLSVFEMTPENTGKTAAEVERVRAAVYNQAMNGFLKAHGYRPEYDEQGKEIHPITTIVTDIADPNRPMYMSATENKFVIDRKYLLSLNRDQAMNGMGHEFGHYSTQDDIASQDQSVANYTGRLLEKHTEKIVAKPVSEATWKSLLNTSSVITGPGADVVARGIAVNEREYVNWGRLGTGAAESAISGFRVAQGVGEVSAGLAITSSGVGAVPGVILVGHGASELVFGVNDGAAGIHKMWLAILDKDTEVEKNVLRENFGMGYELLNYTSAAASAQTQAIKGSHTSVGSKTNIPKQKEEGLNKGYTQVSETKVQGPRGGVYEMVGKTKEGSPVYKSNNSYYTFQGGKKVGIEAGSIQERFAGHEIYYGGRKGNLETRQQNQDLISVGEGKKWDHIGGGEAKEYIVEAEGIEGRNYTDVTLSKNIGGKVVTVHVNTVSTNKDGSLSPREAIAETKINEKLRINDPTQPSLITIPKREGVGNFEEKLEEIERQH